MRKDPVHLISTTSILGPVCAGLVRGSTATVHDREALIPEQENAQSNVANKPASEARWVLHSKIHQTVLGHIKVPLWTRSCFCLRSRTLHVSFLRLWRKSIFFPFETPSVWP